MAPQCREREPSTPSVHTRCGSARIDPTPAIERLRSLDNRAGGPKHGWKRPLGADIDITQLILDDHHEQRRLFAIIEQVDASNTSSLGAIWRRLATFLDVHAETEEKLFYPELLRVGRAAGNKDGVEDETLDAIKDHNKIRDAVAAVAHVQGGTPDWFKAVAAANKANSDHMAEEEREGLTDFRREAPVQLRHDLAVAFAAYETGHVQGVIPIDKDPKQWVAEH